MSIRNILLFCVIHLASSHVFRLEGPKNERIIGGNTAPDGVYPYQVSLRTLTNSHFCGGAIITTKTILTAAHCLEECRSPSGVLAVVGTNSINFGGTIYRISSFILYPDYISFLALNDVGLATIRNEIQYTPTVQPIDIEEAPVGADVNATLTGWGRISYPGDYATRLQYIFLTTIGVTDCRDRMSQVGLGQRIFAESLCTLTRAGEGACHGDSGGPLVAEGKVIGTVSWGKPCAEGYPDVFARVSSFARWINDNKV